MYIYNDRPSEINKTLIGHRVLALREDRKGCRSGGRVAKSFQGGASARVGGGFQLGAPLWRLLKAFQKHRK